MTAWTVSDLYEAVPEDLAARMPVAVWALGIRALTFDCYGTLIDWETGILGAMSSLFERAGKVMDHPAVIAAYGRLERAVESRAYLSYREVLGRVEAELIQEFGLGAVGDSGRALSDSLASWPAFDETPECLRAWKKRFQIGVLSNIDDDLFASSAPKLGVTLDVLVTAEQVRSYKPGEPHFREGLRRLNLRAEQILHVAESRFHDVEPAGKLGFRTCWVNRHAAEGMDNATSASGPMLSGREPDITVGSLRELAAILGS